MKSEMNVPASALPTPRTSTRVQGQDRAIAVERGPFAHLAAKDEPHSDRMRGFYARLLLHDAVA